ncbi:ester cyclase [Candidatus Poribacteria bacterium]
MPASGKKATWTGITMYRFADGKIVEHWWAWDVMGLIKQITE